jgi:hypothetical protein
VSEPEPRSLRELGLYAPFGLDCPLGGRHHVLEPELQIAKADGGGSPQCLKCKQPVELAPLELEG